MDKQTESVIRNALHLVRETGSYKLFLFLSTLRDCRWFLRSGLAENKTITLVVPKSVSLRKSGLEKTRTDTIYSWAGNQTRRLI